MTGSVRPLVAALAGVTLTIGACGDDAPDQAARAERAEALAAEFRASQSTTTVAPAAAPADDIADVAPSVIEPPAPTVPAVEPTGVVVPVVALDNSFRPQVIVIEVGDEVLWENRGLNEHNVLSVAGDDWGVEVDDFPPGAIYAHVFTEPGEFAYYCSIHGNATVGMVGTVIVNG